MTTRQGGAILGAILLVGIYASMFTVNMTEYAIVLEFEEYKRTVTEPGLKFKYPWQKAQIFSKQLLVYDGKQVEIVTGDKKNLLVDSYSMWKIVDPLKFLQTLRTEERAHDRLENIIKSELNAEISKQLQIHVVSSNREAIMERVANEVATKTAPFGIEVIDVRIKRAELPQENAEKVFNRMRTERERIAREYRAQGKEESTKIRAETDKERTILIAEAHKKEQIIMGKGDADATKIYAEAYNKDPKFYSFIRSMEAYRNSFRSDTTILLSEDSDFLEFLNQSK